jgi:hypothetical protein
VAEIVRQARAHVIAVDAKPIIEHDRAAETEPDRIGGEDEKRSLVDEE